MDPTLSTVLSILLPALGALISTIAKAAAAAGDVRTLDQLAEVCPTAEVLARREEAAIVAARNRAVEGLAP